MINFLTNDRALRKEGRLASIDSDQSGDRGGPIVRQTRRAVRRCVRRRPGDLIGVRSELRESIHISEFLTGSVRCKWIATKCRRIVELVRSASFPGIGPQDRFTPGSGHRPLDRSCLKSAKTGNESLTSEAPKVRCAD
jgi:hypothetical protein